jgi:ribosomal-protein-alanine N-acetyltransferase
MDIEKLFTESPTFETERLLLRKINMDDLSDYFEFASDSLVTTYTIWHTHQSLDDSKYFIQYMLQKYNSKEAYHWGIIDKSINKLIGRTGFIEWDTKHLKAEIGFGIASHYWNKGIITEATKPIIEYGFLSLGLNRIEGRCNYNNLGSGRAMEKLGMKFEGTLREQLKMKGEFVDQRMYAILRSDFESSLEEGFFSR